MYRAFLAQPARFRARSRRTRCSDTHPGGHRRTAATQPLHTHALPLSDEEQRYGDETFKRGIIAPRVETEGTLAYLFAFDNGFRLMFLGSAGAITNAERKVMSEIKHTDIAIVAYQGYYLAHKQIAATLPLIKLFQPAIYIPAHHDEIAGFWLDMATYPLFMAIRDELP